MELSQNSVYNGIDVLIESNFATLKGKTVALLTNHAGRTKDCKTSVEAFQKTKECTLKFLLTPEHGFYTTIPAGEHVGNDTVFGLPALSLYGANKKPSKEILSKVDAIVIDIQDIGIRSYTYISSVFKTLDACAEADKEVFILDRPNPIGGLIVDGNVLEKEFESFIGIAPIPYVHGLTVGEFATMANEEGWLSKDASGVARKCKLTVVKMKNWNRWMRWEDTGLQWFPTSPHIPTVDAVRGAAMLGAFGEISLTSIGIGTSSPFQYIGSPTFDIEKISKAFGSLSFEDVEFVPAKYRPFYGMYSGKDCSGFLLRFPPGTKLVPYYTGIKMMLAVRKVYPSLFNASKISPKGKEMFCKATGTDAIFNGIFGKATDEEILRASRKGLKDFIELRKKYLLYE